MRSLILLTALRYMMPLLFLFSQFLLFRGHNHPGGGFVGGLAASAALALYVIGYDARAARALLRVEPRHFIALGLLTAGSSGLFSLVSGYPFMTGKWATLDLPGFGELHLGTPVFFDIGVYLVVIGVVVTIVTSIAEE